MKMKLRWEKMERTDRLLPPCIDVPQNRWGWHWKAVETARFPFYNRNRSVFGRMLNELYDRGLEQFKLGLTFEGRIQRAQNKIRNSGKLIEDTYRMVYENTAAEFAEGFESNMKQLDTLDDEELTTLSLLAVRDFLTARLFARQQRSLQVQTGRILGSHAGIFRKVLTNQAAGVFGIDPSDPIPPLTPAQLNQLSLSARNRFRNHITPVHSKYFSTTETVAASNLGLLAAAMAQQRAGRVLTKFWLSQRDSRVRTTHVQADSQQIPLDGLFRVGNSLLAFPGDWTHGAEITEIINCRCVILLFSQN